MAGLSRGAEISFVPSRHATGLGHAVERIPDVLEKFLEKRGAEKVKANGGATFRST